MEELTQAEKDAFMVFRVTGFFGKKPKPNVGRYYNAVADALLAKNQEVTVDEVVQTLISLDQKGLLKCNDEKKTAHLTDKGYQQILQMG